MVTKAGPGENSLNAPKTASLVVIGDEILTGKVKDDNSFEFAKVMFEQGVHLQRILVIPDEIDVIAQCVRTLAEEFDYVATSGGVGPTHDDKTFDGIAEAFSLPLKEHEEALAYFRKSKVQAGHGPEVNDAQKKMITFPYPCELYFQKPLWLPLVSVKNTFVFPGVPFLFNSLLHGHRHLFKGGQFFREKLYTDKAESSIAQILSMVQEQHSSVRIGSYPQMPGGEFSVMVTVEGSLEEAVSEVAKILLVQLPARKNCHADC